MNMCLNLEDKLKAAFSPVSLEVINESHLHAGHQPGFDGTGSSHLRVRIVSDHFTGKSRLQRHRAVNEVATEAFAAGLHALAVEAKTPKEP